jgi:UDP-N-acetylglucosamine--N-acetylmuramyl-(pentapeptide) pyrophosphoryl-undecaprenol N-acetylglucosamine transferase
MEPNAAPGLTNRWIARYVRRAIVSFEETRKYFPPGITEVTGVPVREEFFSLPAPPAGRPFTVLITGGSQGSRTLNDAAVAAWPRLREFSRRIYLIHQTGSAQYEKLRPQFEQSGVPGALSAFIQDMPAAFSRADLIICRSGAGAVSELAAAGKPSVLVPFPFAADDHQRHNAEQFVRAGAALLYSDRDWNAAAMFTVIRDLAADPDRLQTMGAAARTLAHPGAARRAADILEEAARKTH